MKKRLSLFAIVIIALVLFNISCSKSAKSGSKQETEVLRPETGTLLKVTSSTTGSQQKAKPNCGCQDHGGTLVTTINHYLATCRSQCQRGLGFKCGDPGWYLCNDGAIIACPGGHCPIGVFYNAREMKSTVTFYSNNTVKFEFQRPVPSEEVGNTVFEIEDDKTIDVPEDVLIGGISYESFIAKTGNYYINYSEGLYGSVVFNVILKQ